MKVSIKTFVIDGSFSLLFTEIFLLDSTNTGNMFQ